MTETTTERLKTALKNNPRALHLLFTATVLLSQAGSVAANAGDATAGP